MTWIREEQQTKTRGIPTEEKVAEYDQTKAECLPAVLKEVDSGMKPFTQIKFQPVKSPGIFEAQFASKNDDVIFQFWPPGHHKAVKDGNASPAFRKDFAGALAKAMEQNFDPQRTEMAYIQEENSWYVKAKGYALNEFWKKLAVETCTQAHLLLGGE